MNFRKSRARSRKTSLNNLLNREKWKQVGKRVSKKENDLLFDESDDEEPRAKEIKDWLDEFFHRKSLGAERSDQDIEVKLTKKQTLILSTLVPDEILKLKKFETTDLRRFVGVLMMADVSGYTALSEKYTNSGKGGTYRLTVTLNTYLGSLIELIYNHGGDVIKFAGDAFLALWKTDNKSLLTHTIHKVITCALVIQHSYATYETDAKVNLRVKLAISAGNIIFSPIGTGIDMTYIIYGLPVLEAKKAESVCLSGEVKLTPTAWGHCYSRNYDYIIHEDGHVTIKGILYDPHDRDVTKPFLGFSNLLRQIKIPYCAIENLPDSYFTSNVSPLEVAKTNESLSLRKCILEADIRNIGSEIRRFMIRPVLTQIDAHQPLEYLTEMRQVSVLFITFKPATCPFPQFITIVNNSYKITCEIVYKSMGCVNKIILFDKDVMILVVFGLRGFKHESEAQAALKCSYSIKKSVSALDGVQEVSIGVTTGQVYCGVVGHPLRREFTIIGSVVNKAARLMCQFRNRVTCDETTFVKSKMSTNGFTLQPKTELKGITNPGKIFEYTEEIRVKEMYDIPMIAPLLNRTDEIEYFESWLSDSTTIRDFDALLAIGESRIGKSRLLEWMARIARNKGHRVCYLSLTSIHSATPYLALSQIVNQILGLKEPITGFLKEEHIIHLLKVYDEDLCYLNDIIKVRFAYHEKINSQNEEQRTEKAKEIFKKIIHVIPEKHVIFLDDLHNLDSASWHFLTLMFDERQIYTILSVTRGKFSTVHDWLYSVFINNSVRKMVLGPLSSIFMPPLACQILDVDAVPIDLCNALKLKCKGMPGLVESFILHLFSSGALELFKISDVDLEDWKDEDLQFPNSELLRPQAIDSRDQALLDEMIQKDYTDEVTICVVTTKEELNTNINVQNMDAMIMIQIDSLTPYQQLLLKIASVIGNVLSRELLENIMYENNALITARAVKRLFSMRILTCANAKNIGHPRGTSGTSIVSNNSLYGNLSCDCRFDYDPENSDNLPKYAFCKVMKFRNKNSRKTCYELLPMNQKKEFHSRVVKFLEHNKLKCPNCGGSIMIVQSFINYPSEHDTKHCNFKDSSRELSNTSSEFELQTLNNNSSTIIMRPVSIVSQYDDLRMSPVQNSLKPILETSNPGDTLDNSNNVDNTPATILKTKENLNEDDKRIKRVTIPTLTHKEESCTELDTKVFDMFRAVTEASKTSDWHNLGVIDSQDEVLKENNMQTKSFNLKIGAKVSQTDFNRCTCDDLSIAIYEQLIYHAQKAELFVQATEFRIQSCYLNLLAENTDIVFQTLEDAESFCTQKCTQELISKCDKQRFLGKIYSLRAAACLMTDRYEAAKMHIEKALKIYNINFRKMYALLRFRGFMKATKAKRKKIRAQEKLMKIDTVYCLNIATLLYSAIEEDQISKACAFRAINLIQMVQCNVIDICNAFCNAIQIELNRGMIDSTANLEQMVSVALKNLPEPIQANELYVLGKLFVASFHARMARGQLPAAIRAGFRSLVVSRFLRADHISIDIIPDLFYTLLARSRIEEAIDTVQLGLSLGQNKSTHECETWYYALCLDLILDAGFELEPLSEISRFAEYALTRGTYLGTGRRRLIVNFWTYCLRQNWDKKAKTFETEALSWTARDDDDVKLTTLLSALRLAEGMLECLACKVDDLRKVVDVMELRSIADKELVRLERDARLLRIVYPRWMLLKAVSLKLSGRHTTANNVFNQAIDESRRVHNNLEEANARAAITPQTLWGQSARSGHFVGWRVGQIHAKASWHRLLHKTSTNRYSV